MHELDVAWMIALYQAIHHGDPAPVEVNESTTLAAAALASQLAATQRTGPLTFPQLQQRLGEVGIVVSMGEETHAHTVGAGEPHPVQPPRPYCFQYKGETYCVTVPRPHTEM